MEESAHVLRYEKDLLWIMAPLLIGSENDKSIDIRMLIELLSSEIDRIWLV